MIESGMRIAPRRFGLVMAAVVATVAGAVLYGKKPDGGKECTACAASDAAIARVLPFEKGEVAAAVSPRRGAPVPALEFLGPDGRPMSLAHFRDRVTLVNLWATWCVPCREEMPALDALQGKLGSADFEVIAINIDTTRLDRPKAFLQEAKVTNLKYYADPKADVFYRLKTAGKAVGLPTSILVGRDGCEVATMSGPANWASDDAQALIRAAF